MSGFKTDRLIISFLIFLKKKSLRTEKDRKKRMKFSSMVWSKIFKFLIFSYEILWLVKEEVFTPMEGGKEKLLFFACMILLEIPSCPILK